MKKTILAIVLLVGLSLSAQDPYLFHTPNLEIEDIEISPSELQLHLVYDESNPIDSIYFIDIENNDALHVLTQIQESTSATTNHRLRITSGSTPGASLAESDEYDIPSVFTFRFTANSTSTTIYLRQSESGTVVWDNVSLKEVL